MKSIPWRSPNSCSSTAESNPGGVNHETASGRELKEQNPLVVVVKVVHSPPLEPLLRLLIIDEQRHIEVAGGKGIEVDDAVEELRRIVVPPRDEADDHHAVGGTREKCAIKYSKIPNLF
ncbi:hypothetical protein GYH30_052245 [Glycine max]|nr:hypothetical protein GYH30_052245 [Glycine max]